MAFGISRSELKSWKDGAANGRIVFLTHYWEDPRFPGCSTVTKIGCSDIEKLKAWGKKYQLKSEWIHHSAYPHFDVFGERQKKILLKEKQFEQLNRFNL